MNDRAIGALILALSVLAMVGYFLWFFGPYLPGWPWWNQAASEWAIRIPVIVAVYAVLGILGWIGYTMATTPPPVPIEKTLELGEEGSEKEGKEEGKEEQG